MEYCPPRGEHKKSHVVQQCFIPTDRVEDFIDDMQCGREGAQCKFRANKENCKRNQRRDGHKTAMEFIRFVSYCHSVLSRTSVPHVCRHKVFTQYCCIRRFRCEYGPKDFSHIVKPISEDLLPKPKKKLRVPDSVPEGNTLAPTQKARAKQTKSDGGRKPPRKFKAKTPATVSDAIDWMV